MKKYLVTPTTVLPGGSGPAYPEIKEDDIARVGVNAMLGDAAIVDDFIIKPGGKMVVEGGDFTLTGGMNLMVFKPLRMWRGSDGKEFADLDATPSLLELES